MNGKPIWAKVLRGLAAAIALALVPATFSLLIKMEKFASQIGNRNE